MTKRKNIMLSVTVTYSVAIKVDEMPEDIYQELVESNKKGLEFSMGSFLNGDSYEWLSYNIDENDCFDLSYKIDDIEQE